MPTWHFFGPGSDGGSHGENCAAEPHFKIGSGEPIGPAIADATRAARPRIKNCMTAAFGIEKDKGW
jgi:hypothetical protein